MCTKLYDVAEEKTQLDKIVHYYWVCKHENGKQIIQQLEVQIAVNRERMKAMLVKSSIKSLGACLNHALCQKDHFKIMRNKMLQSVVKIVNLSLNTC